jgi:putative membrane protein
MKKSLAIIFLLSIFMLATCKRAENYNATTTATATATTGTTATMSTLAVSDKDKDFVTNAGKGGMAEVELARDGTTHATNANVKSFAQKMVDDHTKANQELTQLASSKGVTMPSEMEGTAKELKVRLMKLTGKSYDQAFIKQMVDDHTRVVADFEKETTEATDADLKKWVENTLPTLRDHLRMAKDLNTKLSKSK